MDYEKKTDRVILKNPDSFDLKHIFECGQCFRWDKLSDSSYKGVAFGKALKIEKSGDDYIFYTSLEDFENIWCNYFDLLRDYSKIKKELGNDEILNEASAFGHGIRILNQDLFETVISFIISASNNIPRIKGIIKRLCENFGERIEYMDSVFYSFPTPEKLSNLTEEEISVIRSGFRGKYIIAAAKMFQTGEISYENLNNLSYNDAKKELVKIPGVGEKVANCVLLFGLSIFDSFPIDVWIKRIMEHCYFNGESTKNDVIASYAKEHFGSLGGIAQQYLFYWARENKIGDK